MCTFGVEFIHFAMIEKLQGVVLRTIKYNDKNAIVRVYTDMHGVMAFLLPQGNGKVARQRRALFQPLSLVEIVADIRQGRDLYSIKEARCLHPLHSLHTDPVKNAVALFVTELLSAVIVEQERNPALPDPGEETCPHREAAAAATTASSRSRASPRARYCSASSCGATVRGR